MPRRGFTLIEVVIALVLIGLLGGLLQRVLAVSQRLYVGQSTRVRANETDRIGLQIVAARLRGLSATDTAGSDVVLNGPASIRYRAFQNTYFACRPGVGSAVVASGTHWYGWRSMTVSADSLLVFREHDPTTATDDQWLAADVLSAEPGMACPGPAASVTFTLADPAAVQGVRRGAPLRGFQHEEIRAYRDGGGVWWLGMRQIGKTGRGVTQPVVGPLAPAGFRLMYFDRDGAAASDPKRIARIEIALTSSLRSRRRSGGSAAERALVTDVSLRNNCKPPC